MHIEKDLKGIPPYYGKVLERLEGSGLNKIVDSRKAGTEISPETKKLFDESIIEFKKIINQMILLSTVSGAEKLKNLILLQTLYSIKVLNHNSNESFIELDPLSALYYETAYNSLKNYYFDLLNECKKQNFLNKNHDNEFIFTTIQDVILHRYLFYYKTGEISAMIDYINETFDTLILNNNDNKNKLKAIQ